LLDVYRYPMLYDYFVLELEKASKIIIQGSRSKKLHPLLLLLSRLYPSALEGSESNLKVSVNESALHCKLKL